jgi:hypothetical protein
MQHVLQITDGKQKKEMFFGKGLQSSAHDPWLIHQTVKKHASVNR